MREYRAVPMERLIARLHLSEYNVDAPVTETAVIPKVVKINLSQHIGAKAVAVVKKDDTVQKDQVIAVAEDSKLSLPVHTGVSGKVREVNENFIIIDVI